jgi:hypothetical protein
LTYQNNNTNNHDEELCIDNEIKQHLGCKP